MTKTKKLLTIPVLFLVVMISLSNFAMVQAYAVFPIRASEIGYVYKIVNDEYESQKNIPAIDIVELRHEKLNSRLVLELSGQPNLSSLFEYWILLAWDTQTSFGFFSDWKNPNWELALDAKVNLTVCVAGGANFFGAVNGSYSVFYNSNDVLISSEIQNNTVSISDNTLIFPYSSSNYVSDNLTVIGNLVYTMFNASTPISESVFYLDSMPARFILGIFGLLPTFPEPVFGFSMFSSIFICVVVFVRKRKLS
ncbi:MAG: hypothetical protein ACTSR1_00540 [Candidatus Heimdallarchaeota archaeon]